MASLDYPCCPYVVRLGFPSVSLARRSIVSGEILQWQTDHGRRKG